MTALLLIRHAPHEALADTLCGRMPDLPLSQSGRQTAQALARSLSGIPLTALYSSPRRRAQETATPIATSSGISARVDAALDELDCGVFTGRSFTSLEGDPRWLRWNGWRMAARLPGGETMAALQRRIVDRLDEIALCHPRGVVAVVSHAEPIRAALLHANGWPLSAWQRVAVRPASVHLLHHDGQRWQAPLGGEARAA